jgi:hypothetical protein
MTKHMTGSVGTNDELFTGQSDPRVTEPDLLADARDGRRSVEAFLAAERAAQTDGHGPGSTDASRDSVSLAGTTATFTASAVGSGSAIQGDDGDNDLGDPSATTSLTIHGGMGWDVLRGGSADDQLYGEEDFDFLMGGAGNGLIDGGDGFDTVSYETETGGAGIVLNMSESDWSYNGAVYGAFTGTDTWGNLDTLASIEMVLGSAYDDVVYAGGLSREWSCTASAETTRSSAVRRRSRARWTRSSAARATIPSWTASSCTRDWMASRSISPASAEPRPARATTRFRKSTM